MVNHVENSGYENYLNVSHLLAALLVAKVALEAPISY